MPRTLARSLLLLWLALFASWSVTAPAGLLLIAAAGVSRGAMADAATLGISTVSIPAIRKIEASGLPEDAGIFAVNGAACLVLFLLPFGFRIQDVTRVDRFPRFLRRTAMRSPTLFLWKPFPAFRKIPTPGLRVLYENLVVLPFFLPLLMGAILGLLTAALVLAGSEFASILFAVTLVLPHGVFELTALFLPLAYLWIAYAEVRGDLEAGAAEAAWARLRAFFTARKVLPRYAVSLGLLAAAAVVESRLTVPIARLVAGAAGMEF